MNRLYKKRGGRTVRRRGAGTGRGEKMKRKMTPAEAQAFAFKFTVAVFLTVVILIGVAGYLGGLPKRRAARIAADNDRAAAALFRDTALTASEAEPVIRKPYTVYGQKNDGTWAYRAEAAGAELLAGPDITENVADSRTCLLIWLDIDARKKSDKYYWKSGQAYAGDAYFAPVYLTVIDREKGIRYADVKLGVTPLTGGNKYSRKHSGYLYSQGGKWSELDLDEWFKKHVE